MHDASQQLTGRQRIPAFYAGGCHEVCKVRARAEEEQEAGGEADGATVSTEGGCAADGSRCQVNTFLPVQIWHGHLLASVVT